VKGEGKTPYYGRGQCATGGRQLVVIKRGRVTGKSRSKQTWRKGGKENFQRAKEKRQFPNHDGSTKGEKKKDDRISDNCKSHKGHLPPRGEKKNETRWVVKPPKKLGKSEKGTGMGGG